MATDQPSGSDDPGQHPDRHAEQGRQHSPDHGNQPSQDHAQAGTRSRSEYAATVRGAGWGDQSATRPREPTEGTSRASDTPARSVSAQDSTGNRPRSGSQHTETGEAPRAADTPSQDNARRASRSEHATQPREQQPPAGTREHAPPSSRWPGDSPGAGGLPGQSPAQPRQPAVGSDSTRDGDTHRPLEPGSDKPEKGTGTDGPARHEAAPDTGSHAKDSTSAEKADIPGRGAYADSLRAQDPWRAGDTETSETDQRGTASAPEQSGQAGDRSNTTRTADPGPSWAEASGAGHTDAAAETGQSHGQEADSPDDQASGQHLPTSDQPAKPDQTQADSLRTPSPGEAGKTTRERQENEGTSDAGSSGDLAGQANGAIRDGETGPRAERPAETTEPGQLGDATSSTDAPPSQADRDRWRAMYQEFLQDATAGRDQGINVVGGKPDRSLGDTSDLPPSGEQLLHMEKEEASRPEKLRNKFLEEVGDATDSAKSVAQTTQDVLERPAPVGQPEIRVPAGPYVAPEVPQHTTISAGSVAETAVILGVVVMEAGNRIMHRLAERRRGS